MKELIKSSEFKKMPWKNGLGVTAEISISPVGTDFTKGDFLWRLSSAQIKSNNTFSNFPGYDRILVVLSGDGLKLNDFNLLPHHIYKFKGEDQIECSLLGSEVEDLGIIYDRELYKCEMHVLEVERKSDLEFFEGTHFLKPLVEGFLVDNVSVESTEVLRIAGPDQVEVNCSVFPAKVLILNISS